MIYAQNPAETPAQSVYFNIFKTDAAHLHSFVHSWMLSVFHKPTRELP